MARFLSNKHKYLRRFGMLPTEESRSKASRPRRKTDFGVRLEEKQKLKFVYGVLERQLHRYAREAFRSGGDPREALLRRLEARLDNVVYRLGFALTRPQTRQLVSHRHVLVDGKKVDIRSYSVRPGQTVALTERTLRQPSVQESLSQKKPADIPAWLERDTNDTGHIRRLPAKEDLPQDIDMQRVIEFLFQRVKR
jgi:small subunit ribosomal protein S4